MGPTQVVLGIVQKIEIQGAQPESFQAAAQLILQKPGMNAVFQSLGIDYELLERISFMFALLADPVILTLQVPNLGHHHNRFSGELSRSSQIP